MMTIPCENNISVEGEYTWHSPGSIRPGRKTQANAGRFLTAANIHAIASGAESSFCDFQMSAYRTGAFGGIWKFSITYDGRKQDAYCIEKGVTGASGNPYAFVAPDDARVQLTARQQRRIAYILANASPVLTADKQFTNAGVSSAASPPLDENDAYAAAQVAIWSVQNEPSDHQAGWSFYNCSDGAPHPKSDRLKAAISYLFEQSALAADAGEETLSPAECGSSAALEGATLVNRGGKRVLHACGKLLYGPMMVRGNAPFSLTLTAICPPECLDGFITLTDACGRQISSPTAGQEFYVAFPEMVDAACYQMTLAVAMTLVDIAIMENTDAPPNLQTLVFTPRCQTGQRTASLCFCFAPPPKKEKCPPLCAGGLTIINTNRLVSGCLTDDPAAMPIAPHKAFCKPPCPPACSCCVKPSCPPSPC